MENNIIEAGKNKNLIIGVMACVVLLLAALLVYFVFIKKDSSVEPNKSQDNNQIKVEPYDASAAYNLLLNIGYSNKDYYSTSVVNVANMQMSDKVGKAIELIEREEIVSEKVVKEKYTSLFSDTYSSVKEAFTGCELWSYDNNGNYKLKEGGGCGSGSISKDPMAVIVSANKKGDKLEIVAYIAMFDLYEKHELRDYTNNNLVLQDSSINEKLDNEDGLEKFNLSQYGNKFQHYTFTFLLKNGNYVLYSVEPSNN